MLITFYDSYTILNKIYHGEYIKQALNNTQIDEKTRALTSKIVYGVLDKDIELSYYIKYFSDKSPKLVIRTILKIAMYSIKYLNKKEYAVTTSAVELTKKLGKGGTSGFVNAFLRKFINEEAVLPEDEIENLSIKNSYPLFAVKELINDYGMETAKKVISDFDNKTCVCFYDEDGEKYLTEKKINFTKTPYKNVFLCENFVRNKDFDKGIYTFQNLGSVAICEAVEPCDSILDCCSAPGGKAIRLSYKCKNILALDVHPHRVELISDYVKRMKRTNIETAVYDATIFNNEFKDKFDVVLCDSPCSGFGVLKDNPDIALNKDIDNVIELSKIQLSILNNVKNYVKKGGYLYYSTCSVFKKENVEVVNEFLKSNGNYVLEKIDCKLNHLEFFGTIQLLPNVSESLGFYIAKFKRIS